MTLHLLKTCQLATIFVVATIFSRSAAAPTSDAESDPMLQLERTIGANCVAMAHDDPTNATWVWSYGKGDCDKVFLANGTANPCEMEPFPLTEQQPPGNFTLNGCGGPLWMNANGTKFADCTAVQGEFVDICDIRANYLCKP
ncbi:hypothetical protein C8R43DRAFT_1122177 [Mycena crocata]|nr:hypothetical protein C8R43DRAFT_1122177 [Mycena crocata]